jgi:cytochrome oxidase Cu insertion factor (SCO1/SenC/PrrC family)
VFNSPVLWAAAFLLAIASFGCDASASKQADNDDLFTLPQFTLTERDGSQFGLQDLKGKVWVASFVFTRCAGPCTRVSGTMARLQHELADEPDARLVSFSVDPEYDRPQVLSDYARKFAAQPGRWYFLTGDPKQVYGLIRDGFHLTAQPNQGAERTPGNEVMHDTRLLVVDRRSHVRAYYDSSDPDAAEAVRSKVRKLLTEKR